MEPMAGVAGKMAGVAGEIYLFPVKGQGPDSLHKAEREKVVRGEKEATER